jgi:DNA-directed RNA polymerase subunit M/transcription elongation factor TFIIS
MEEEYRIKGKNALKTVLKNEQNIIIFDKYIYEKSSEEELYLSNIYQLIEDLSNGISLKKILNDIKNDNLNWKHLFFTNMISDELEQDNFIENPFEIEEGVLECKCGSKRVFSYQKQSRSADEPMSTYANCVACGNKWCYSG